MVISFPILKDMKLIYINIDIFFLNTQHNNLQKRSTSKIYTLASLAWNYKTRCSSFYYPFELWVIQDIQPPPWDIPQLFRIYCMTHLWNLILDLFVWCGEHWLQWKSWVSANMICNMSTKFTPRCSVNFIYVLLLLCVAQSA